MTYDHHGSMLVPMALLAASHHVSFRPPNWLGAAPITAQTLALSINAISMDGQNAAVALAVYLAAGAVAALAPAQVAALAAPFGPTFSKGTMGFIVGFVPGSLITRAVFAAIWHSFHGAGSGVQTFGAAVMGQNTGNPTHSLISTDL